MILKILIVEDLETDVEIITHEIRKVFVNCEIKNVLDKKNFLLELENFKPDIILSDYKLPFFSGIEAIKIVKKLNADIPVVIVTGSQNEDIAVDCMKVGAADYILKEQIKRIGLAVKNILIQKEEKLNKILTENALKESLLNYKEIFDSVLEGIFIFDSETYKIIEVNESALKIFGYDDKRELIDLKLGELNSGVFPFTNEIGKDKIYKTIFETKQTFEWYAKKKNGELFWVEISAKKTEIGGKGRILGVVRDINEKKQTLQNLTQINECLINLGISYEENVNNLIRLLGELLNASFTLYNKIFKEKFYQIGKWNVPENFISYELSEESLCNNNILKENKSLLFFRNLQNSNFSFYDKNIKNFNLQTYLGKNIFCDGVCIGSLSAIFQHDIELTYEKEQIVNIIASAISMQENKHKIELALIESEEKYHTLFDIAPVGIILEKDNGDIIEVNEAICKSSGYTREELIGNNVEIFLNSDSKFIAKENIDKIISGETLIVEVESLNKNGSIHNVELYERSILFPDGEKGILSISNYITDRKNAEKQVLRERDNLNNILNSSPVAMFVLNKDFTIVFTNTAVERLFGKNHSKINGLKCGDLLKCINRNEHVKGCGCSTNCESCMLNNTFQQVFETQKGVYDFETKVIIENEDVQTNNWLRISIEPVYMNNEFHAIVAMTDVTERKKLIEELIEAKEKSEQVSLLKSRLLSNLSHEIRTPLNGILGFAELLKDELIDESHALMAETIHSSGTRLMDTLNSILDLSLIESDSSKIDLKKTNLNNLVIQSFRLFSALAMKKGLSLKSQFIVDPLNANVDESIVEKILNNLINNAIKFTIKGEILIKSNIRRNNETEFACIEVCDTGIGIEKNHLSLIFEEFRQVSEGKSRSYEGTGLGLNISMRFANLLGGNITVESVLNKGSVFTLWLPLHKETTDNLNENEIYIKKNNEMELTKRGDSEKLILLVEDDEINVSLINIFLKGLFKLESASDGIIALQKVSEKKFDAILMDISLKGGISGLEVTKEIRKNNDYANVPIAALTAHAMTGNKEEYLNIGCTHYLAKPFTKKDLIKLINEMLNI